MHRCIQCLQPIHETLTVFNFYRPREQFCQSCQKQWETVTLDLNSRRCPRCLNKQTTDSDVCLDCQFLEKTFTLMSQLYCDYQYTGVMKEVIHNYKFMRDYYLAKVLASKLKPPKTSYDMIVPIPSPYERDAERTFNPVTTVLDYMGVTYINLLKTKLRPKQSQLGKIARAQASNPFYIEKEIDITNKEILLVDDIYTTGLTVHHAGEILCDKNVRKFKVFAFSR
ncbi:ComF family protein [Staphylococcus sp. NRL 16/872]|uniref:ComF family protein n=1 Tax=Staphylococcus sp. NRL 16/872 TaxID=2930131 RepID=UPI001FB46787|nr:MULTISPECIES: ComF family protein [unclassified Staphylococcus]MCJ1656902.1 ComF family protein [Staphylococcus sp. NRL 21/187]MCJ1662647.1 ComF family protein [Staphylococcus sp. NRL 18/288]MCJ1668752.1 ComF family protein [Staphylococcus sp. NRL 19/737]WEN68967.1 ComF family protein [Staphylococcus sp. NRL 16/872]